MKKLILLASLFATTATFAQLKVDSLGHVGIATDTIISKLAIGGAGFSDTDVSIRSAFPISLNILQSSSLNQDGEQIIGLKIQKYNFKNVPNYGLYSNSFSFNNTEGTSNIGVYGNAAGGWNGHCYGIVGLLGNYLGIRKGAGVLGGINTFNIPSIDGYYAGYFAGNVKVTGTINGTLVSPSDLRLKEDVEELHGDRDGGILSRLDLLTPVSFRYKEEAFKNKDLTDDAVDEGLSELDEDGDGTPAEAVVNPVLEKTHFGLIAQEVQEVFPELVYENDNGYLSVNYTELIPVLLQSIKELRAEVSGLRAICDGPADAEAQGKAVAFEGDATSIEGAVAQTASMGQNMPNPFSEKTDIPIMLPETVKTAMLYISGLNGRQTEQHEVTGRGKTTMTIHADRMAAGMYIYALVADGKVVTSRKMIVTK